MDNAVGVRRGMGCVAHRKARPPQGRRRRKKFRIDRGGRFEAAAIVRDVRLRKSGSLTAAHVAEAAAAFLWAKRSFVHRKSA